MHFPKIPGYEIVRQLGRGGMGVVYLARELALNRLVALKIVAGGAFAESEVIERFQREAEAVASMQHPNIIQIFQVGVSSPDDNQPACPFIALEYADGGTLAAHTGKPVQPRVVAQIVATLADAMQYAHSRGVVHRDLKPGNVLLRVASKTDGDDGDLFGRLIPKITDFGLAKRIDVSRTGKAGDSQTLAGSMLGTPEYMAPEQANGQINIGPEADVYALGVILYELLTGRVPLQGADALDTLVLVRSQDPPPPSRIQARLPRDLDTICMQCLQKDPSRRYRHASAIASDLRAWLEGMPITARPTSFGERAWKWAQRRPAVASLLLTVFMLALAGFAGIFWQWQRAEARATSENNAHRQVELALGASETNLYFGRVSVAHRELVDGNLWDSLRNLDACIPAFGQPDRRGWEWYYLKNASRAALLSFSISDDWVWDISYSPDGTMLATATGTPYIPDRQNQPGELALWDAKTGKLIRRFKGHTGTVRRLNFSPDGRYLCSTSFDRTMRVWNVDDGSPFGRPCPCTLNVWPASDMFGDAGPCWFTPDSRCVEFGGPEGWCRLDLASGEVSPLPLLHQMISRSTDGRFALMSENSKTFDVIEMKNGRKIGRIEHPQNADRYAISPDGQSLLLSNAEHLERFDLATGKRGRIFEGFHSWIETIVYSNDGNLFAAAGSGRIIHVWNNRHHHGVAYAGHDSEVRQVAFSPDGQQLASCDRSGRVMVWDLTRNPRQQLIDTHCGAWGQIAIGLSADGQHVMSAFGDQRLFHYDMRGKPIKEVPINDLTRRVEYPRLDVTFSRDGTQLVGPRESEPNVVCCWDSQTGQLLREFRQHSHPISGTAQSNDGRRLATRALKRKSRTFETEVWVWDMTTGEKLHDVTAEPIVAMSLNSDGSKLAGANRKGEVILWDVATGRELWRRVGHHVKDFNGKSAILVFASAFSPDNKWIATGGFEDGCVHLWNVETGEKKPGALQGRPTLTGVAFTPDSKRIASVGYDSEVRMWDVATGQFALSLPSITSRRADLAYTARPAFSLHNQRMAVLNWDGIIACWDGSEKTDAQLDLSSIDD